MLTQKREPLLAQIETRLDLEQGALVLSCRGEGEVRVPLRMGEGEQCVGRWEGGEARDFFTLMKSSHFIIHTASFGQCKLQGCAGSCCLHSCQQAG